MINEYEPVRPFRFWCQKVLPLVYDESLSYYELLDKVVHYINTLIENGNVFDEELRALADELERYKNEIDENIENIVDEVIEQYFAEHPEVVIPNNGVTFAKLNDELKERFYEAGYVKYYFPFLSDESGSGYSGTCFLAITSQGKTCMFDAGPTSDWSAISSYFDKLVTAGILTNIDYIFISHYHNDHVQNLASILGRYQHEGCVAYVAPKAERFREERTSGGVTVVHDWNSDCEDNYQFVITSLSDADVERIEVNNDMEIEVDGNFTVTLWNVTSTDYNYYYSVTNCRYNNYSMVCLFKVRNSYSMYPADIEYYGEYWVNAVHASELKRLFMYVVHHHAIENNDYLPFLDTIDPEYSVVSTSHTRSLITGASSFAVNWFKGYIVSTAYTNVEIVQGADGGIATYGDELERVGWEYSDVNFYVDNTYSGAVHDGTQTHPFTEINEALIHMKQNGHFRYYIYVKPTATRYGYVWAHDITSAIKIRVWTGYEGKPKISGMYIRGCTDFDIAGMKFDGTGRLLLSRQVLVYIENTTIYMNNCEFDGASLTSSSSKHTGLTSSLSTVYINGCTIKNVAVGIDGYLYSITHAQAMTFDTVSEACYNNANLNLTVQNADTLTDVNLWVATSGNSTYPIRWGRNAVNSTNVLLLDDYLFSEPFYRTDSHPFVAQIGKHLYDVSIEQIW